MPRIILYLVAFLLSVSGTAQVKSPKKEIKKGIETFFEGLHKGDSTIIKNTLYKDIKIQTTHTNKKGENFLKTKSMFKLLSSIANKKVDIIYKEKLLFYDIKVDGNLASGWTPYEFYLNGTFSHCGANSFQLFNNNRK